ncbi:molybdate ABC transporter substrate-binding protein [Microbacterium sp. JB110]|uniref:molybdate ABC transporter substrate-binding protein n=1 Tax=Microbacterium sp. JB110 TaxID=2024477 RepID=UPI000B34EB32|nr:molybdate ABC transporter substrate-binding protein [Microbacterium sp. JB110]RCS63160.1 molybdate ABC transporter substrate-binding protein [Microbacterium sp. JB110]
MRRLVAATAAASGVLLAGCAGPADGDGTPVTVFAAASLQGAFEEIAAAFEAEHPDVDIRPIVTDGSNVLVTQIEEGAAPDIVATANEQTFDRIADDVSEARIFATNTLVIVTPPDAETPVSDLADLADPGLNVVLCAPEVPCGAASGTLLDSAGVDVTPASEEQNVTAVLTKVETQVADAGLVYRTDVVGRDVGVLDATGADEVISRYPIGVLDAAPEPDAAAEFVDYVTGDSGRAVLEARGFGAGSTR